MAQQNSIANKSSQLTIDPGASGDSFVQFDINTTGEFRIGVDDDASDAFKLSQGSALGTNDTFVMTATGENRRPLQPAFLAYVPTDDANVTGDGTLYVVGTNTALTEVFDQNGDFNTNGTFTAPVTGRYMLYFWVKLYNFDEFQTSDGLILIVTTSNAIYWGINNDPSSNVNPSREISYSMSIIADMDSSDTAQFSVGVSNDGGTGIGITGVNAGSVIYSGVSGYLVC